MKNEKNIVGMLPFFFFDKYQLVIDSFRTNAYDALIHTKQKFFSRRLISFDYRLLPSSRIVLDIFSNQLMFNIETCVCVSSIIIIQASR
jgi:hypothetical protein